MRSIFPSILLVSILGCARQPTQHDVELQGAPDPAASYRAVMSFASLGAGIDQGALDDTFATIGAYDVDLTPDLYTWGLEGERNLCFSLRGLNAQAQALLIDELEQIASAGQLVTVHENTACDFIAATEQ